MKVHFTFTNFLSLVGSLAVALAILAALFLHGRVEQIVLNVAGIALVVSSITAQRIPDSARKERQEIDASIFDGVKALMFWTNIASVIGVLSSLISGYLIFFCSDEFPGRRIFLVLTAVFVFAGIGVARLLDKQIENHKDSDL